MLFIMFQQIPSLPLDPAGHEPALLTALVDCFVILCALALSTKRY